MTTTLRPVPAVGAVDPFSPEVLGDPLPFHAALRDAGPVVPLSRYDGLYGMGRHADVHAALVDWQRFCSGAGVGLSNFRREEPWRPPSLLLETDPPHHDAPRHVLAPILGPRALRRLQGPWFAAAEEHVEDLLADAGPGETVAVDAMPALAESFPLRVFPDAVGIPREGREHLLPYGDHLFNAFGPSNELVAKGAPHVAEHAAWVNAQCRREVLSDDGFGAAIWAAADRGDITGEQAPLVVRSLLSAGVDTTVHGLGAVLRALATHPDAWARLRHDPALARVVFDEAIRWESPVQTFFRTAEVDVPVGDTVVPEGAKILMFLGSANHDPRRWTDPDRFDLTRDPSGHVGFGMGLHQCVGQHVARLEAAALLAALAARVERIEVAAEPTRHLNNTMRAFASQPMRLHLGQAPS
ncbi:cytochrome P450 [Actinomycetospora endophytica]|uniref:Cytochrome P450 n=1 Tax=Actinomycetospora endophytica TaxID=2291215 RepID=A0ABS8P188_9PSEU|nr:cytochrome P450 [Actinomycetospora endophytica]MCD2192010.1 cytochrome P450 [Actinomycetospora endophytica]